MKIRRKIELAGLAAMLALGAAIFGVGYWLLSNHFLAQAERSVQQKARVVQFLMASHPKGSDPAQLTGTADDMVFVDQVKSLLDVECTLFKHDLRVATTITKPDGGRAVGTVMDNPRVIDQVLHQGKLYCGANTILGQEFETVYLPLADAGGGVAGMLFLGESRAAVTAAYRNLLLAILPTIALFLVLISLGSHRIIRGITRPLEAVGALLGEVAKGNLTVRAQEEQRDEVGAMGKALNATIHELRRDLGGIQAIAEQTASSASELSGASSQLASATTEISTGADQQHAAMERSSRDLKAMAGALTGVREKTTRSSELTDHTLEVITECRLHMDAAVRTMGDILESSSQVGGITQVISDLSRQTNLLSLNAAIEAAKAGQNGKGFAVVADEIRKLAERSAQSAKEITALVQVSAERGQAGVTAVAQVHGILSDIETSARACAAIALESTEALREQAQVGVQAVDSMDLNLAVVERNVAATAQLTASIRETNRTIADLAGSAAKLQHLVRQFKLA